MDIMAGVACFLFVIVCLQLAMYLSLQKENVMFDDTINDLRKEVTENERRFRHERAELETKLKEFKMPSLTDCLIGIALYSDNSKITKKTRTPDISVYEIETVNAEKLTIGYDIWYSFHPIIAANSKIRCLETGEDVSVEMWSEIAERYGKSESDKTKDAKTKLANELIRGKKQYAR